MAYITREDGERFVIPSYRDVLTVRQKSELKKEIQTLSQSYGEYITLNRKTSQQYEVAFSQDTGYLLGESIWHYFRKPQDLIYCEAIPSTTEVILVIVKNGSVYLDGSFPSDSIQEELVAFLTQRNNFEIYIYGDVPLSEMPEPGKFSFEASSIKSFTVLERPAFPNLPLLKNYQLQLVDVVLAAHGIGVFPLRQLIIIVIGLGLLWMLYSWLTETRVGPVTIPKIITPNPYATFVSTLSSPAPDEEISAVLQALQVLNTLPGWTANTVKYANGNATIGIHSAGGRIEDLNNWAQTNQVNVNIDPKGISLNIPVSLPSKRSPPSEIYPLKDTLSALIDRIASVYPGNHLQLGGFIKKGVYTQEPIQIAFQGVSPLVIDLIGQQLKGLPIVLQDISITLNNGTYSGTISLLALGQ